MSSTKDSPSEAETDKSSKSPVEVIGENEDELKETQEIREHGLRTVREMILKEDSLNSRTDDSFLLRFLRARKYDCDRSFKLLSNYYRLRSDFPDIFYKIRPSEVMKAIENNVLTVLPQRDQHGRSIIIIQLGKWSPTLSSMNELLRAVEFCFEMSIKGEEAQKQGVVVIVNFQDFGFRQFKEVRYAHLRLYAALLQNSFPARFKELHIVNEHYFFHILYAIIYPLLTKKIKERLKFHGSNMQGLVPYITPDILPEEYGGTQPPLDNSSFVEELLTYDDEFVEDAKYGYKLKVIKI